LKLRAEVRAGEWLAEMKTNGELKQGGDRKSKNQGREGTTLIDANITRDQSSNWQKLANIPTSDREHYIAEKKDKGEPISSREFNMAAEHIYKQRLLFIFINSIPVRCQKIYCAPDARQRSTDAKRSINPETGRVLGLVNTKKATVPVTEHTAGEKTVNSYITK